MSSGQSDKEKLFDQWSAVMKMVVDKTRTSVEVSNALQPIISESRLGPSDDSVRTYWEERWRDLGVKFDPAKVIIPAVQSDLTRVIMMPRGIRQNQLRDICKGLFPCWFNDTDLDKVVPFHDRFPLARSYAIRVRDRVEADEEMKNLSANQLAEAEVVAETLPERLVHEVDFFETTKGHLDMNNATLCAGSRYSDGYVPDVYWYGGQLYVGWCYPGSADGPLRARAAVV